jgi:hypothetical protein
MPADYPGTKGKAPAVDEGQGDDLDPTHDLLLTDGSVVPSTGGIPTHVAVGDRVIPVLSVTERQ